ncbi:Putative glycoside hydrolase, family 3, glycoside hydrolase family 3 domain, immunoglobulin [Septoria linicola]|uniref:Probable beta-glucosidase E n=1 Tax=Septoria linicola TaxID=215465 RepID=A0A9Q9AP41_9PEZI|nr:Putative glycoside hydrolase, family 3, glycoside hydrolase family 3 domain, immunoglobulin [Septoria linicola]
MPLTAPDAYEMDQHAPSKPFLGRHSRQSFNSDAEDDDDLDSLHQRYKDDDYDDEKHAPRTLQPPVWTSNQQRRSGWQRLIPTRFACGLITLFFVTLILLLSAGGLWAYKVVPENGQSPPWYPAPNGGTTEGWAASYEKAARLVGQMSLPEKVNITTGTGWQMGPCVGNTGQVDRLGFPSLCLQDGPLGMRFVDNGTSFPAGITVGATWNKELMYQRGRAHGFEARLKGINVILGPSMGPLGRLPAGGRAWEGFGSDPVLQAVAAAQTIRGIQDSGVIATAKHFVANEQEHFRQSWEWGTPNAISSNIDDRTLHELYAWPFSESIRAGVASVMCSYNQVNNSYACQNSKLMNGIIKDEMGFQGFIQSDWLAQRSGVAAALAGLDMSMPGDGLKWQDGVPLWGGELTKAALNGSVPIERLNDMVLRVVASWYQLGQDDSQLWKNNTLSSSATFSSWTDDKSGLLHPGSPGNNDTAVVNRFIPVRQTEEGGDHDELARNIATEGIVMVKNEAFTLPLSKNGENMRSAKSGKKVKVGIFGEDAFPNPKGPNACEDRGCNEWTLGSGWGSGASNFPYLVAPFDALNKTFDQTKVEVTAYKEQDAENAGSIAASQDLCMVFVTSDAGEGFLRYEDIRGDRNDLKVQKHGEELISKVAKKCKGNTVVVLHSVGPTIVENWVDLPGVKAVLLAHLPGQESGNALADVVFGHVNPSGHLPYTIAKHEDDYGPTSKILTFPNHVVPQQNFTEGLYIDYRYFDKHDIDPRFEFGYGLSYTDFNLSSITAKGHGATSTTPAPRPAPASHPPQLDTSIPDRASALLPDGFKRLQKYIYPYIDSKDKIHKAPRPDYPPGFDLEKPSPPSEAGGGEGGNPDLFTSVAEVSASVTNMGHVSGSAVVQLYISWPERVTDQDGEPVDMPIRVLRAFDKLDLESGSTGSRKEVKFSLTRKDLSYWDVKVQRWIMPKGEYTVWLGFSSRDLPLSVKVDPFVVGALA